MVQYLVDRLRPFTSLQAGLVGADPNPGLGRPTDADFFIHARREFTGNIQLTEPPGILAESLEKALDDAWRTFVEPTFSLPGNSARTSR